MRSFCRGSSLRYSFIRNGSPSMTRPSSGLIQYQYLESYNSSWTAHSKQYSFSPTTSRNLGWLSDNFLSFFHQWEISEFRKVLFRMTVLVNWNNAFPESLIEVSLRRIRLAIFYLTDFCCLGSSRLGNDVYNVGERNSRHPWPPRQKIAFFARSINSRPIEAFCNHKKEGSGVL